MIALNSKSDKARICQENKKQGSRIRRYAPGLSKSISWIVTMCAERVDEEKKWKWENLVPRWHKIYWYFLSLVYWIILNHQNSCFPKHHCCLYRRKSCVTISYFYFPSKQRGKFKSSRTGDWKWSTFNFLRTWHKQVENCFLTLSKGWVSTRCSKDSGSEPRPLLAGYTRNLSYLLPIFGPYSVMSTWRRNRHKIKTQSTHGLTSARGSWREKKRKELKEKKEERKKKDGRIDVIPTPLLREVGGGQFPCGCSELKRTSKFNS